MTSRRDHNAHRSIRCPSAPAASPAAGPPSFSTRRNSSSRTAILQHLPHFQQPDRHPSAPAASPAAGPPSFSTRRISNNRTAIMHRYDRIPSRGAKPAARKTRHTPGCSPAINPVHAPSKSDSAHVPLNAAPAPALPTAAAQSRSQSNPGSS